MPLGEEPQDEYAPYDPSTVRPTSSGPQRGHAADDTEPHQGADVSGEEPDGEEDEGPLPAFDPRYQEDFDGLAFLGALTKSFNWIGHRFTIRTLTTDELLSIALLVKDYEGTIGATKAYATAVVALATMSVDGKGLPTQFQEEPGNAYAEYRFRWVAGQWYPYTINRVYDEWVALEAKVQKVLDAMGKASG